MTKPDLPKWVTDDDPTKITDPGSTKKLAGWLYKERPPFQFWNWLWNRASKWFLGLQGNYFDIVVGSATQVTNLEATHTIADLNDALVVAGSRVLFLDGTHTMAASLALSNSGLKIECEPQAIIDLVSTYTLTFSGTYVDAKIRAVNAAASSVVVSGADSKLIIFGADLTALSISNGAQAFAFSGVNGGIETEIINAVSILASGGFSGNLTGTADNATTWNGSNKTVSTSAPSGGADGDIWFQRQV